MRGDRYRDDNSIVSVGYFGDVNLSEITPLFQHPHMRRLDNILQLGVDYHIFPGTRHTRLEHSISTAALARRIVRNLCRHGFDLLWEKPMLAYGLLHDAGHLPFSHVIEHEANINLDKNTIDLLDCPCPRGGPTIREAIRSVGIEDRFVQALLDHTAPEHVIVKDRNIGADKLSYVFMDNHYSGFCHHPPNLDVLVRTLGYVDGVFGVAEKGTPALAEVMRLYIDLRLHVYGHPGCTVFARMLQKAVEIVHRNGEFTTKDMLCMDDTDLESALRYSWNDEARELASRIRYAEVPPVAVAFQYSRSKSHAASAKTTLYVPLSLLQQFYAVSRNPHELTRIESRIAKELAIPPHDVYLPQPVNLAKTYPKDTPVISKSGVIGSVFERYPRLEEELKCKVNDGIKMYVCARPPCDDVIRRNVSRVQGILDEELARHEL